MAETVEAFELESAVVTPRVSDVFLSYTREDQAVARRFAEAFEISEYARKPKPEELPTLFPR
jgi:hypothetical protein